ncbi:uncharacterized protein LOC129124232 [Agelaius phoeniceus]|uniref:uncharacterized protein LOC129124232 n=1 Tax=Agelaius phoeniceus TaxID=39638 RepID=UPI004054D8F3
MRLSLKAFAFSRREKKLPKNGKEEIYHIICLSTGFPLGLWRFPRGNYFPLTETTGQCDHLTNSVRLIWRICQVNWMSQHRQHNGLQLRARARTWRMCRQTEREPGEEKPKWIHSLSWMEEERRREGDVRASFNCLCPVKSAQTPGAAPDPGVRADFRAELPIKPLAATTLLWHRHRGVAPFRTLSAAGHSPKEKRWRPPYRRRDPPSVPGSV